jgi:zinc/manganese transport system ATP-binding protein
MISHDLDIVKNHFQETLLLVGEPVAWGKTEDVLTPHNLRQAKTLSRPLAS